jgi:hypothetical protein
MPMMIGLASLLCLPAVAAPTWSIPEGVERDPHVGYDPVATQAAKQSVKDFLKTALKLN